jgi:aryl-alcohol dehydrogenase-like predicted oxidoreductase
MLRRELGIGFVPYSPLGRGFFAGAELQSAGDIRQVNYGHPLCLFLN